MLKKITYKFIVLLLLLVISDYIIGKVLKELYFSQKSDEYYTATVALEKQTADVLILGSSRAHYHYDPAIITDSVNGTVYNAGRSGYFLVYHSAILDIILERHIPRVVILDVTPYDLNYKKSDIYDRLSVLLPYYSDHPSCKRIMRKCSFLEPIKCLSNVYRFNGIVFKALGNQKIDENCNNGFEPVKGIVSQPFDDLDLGISSELDDKLESELMHIITQCKSNNIRLVLVTSPFYANVQKTNTLKRIDKIAAENRIPYLNYLNKEEYKDSTLFFDIDHLNAEGAKLFTSNFSHDLIQVLAQHK